MTIKLVYFFNLFIEKAVFSWLRHFNSHLKNRYEFESKNQSTQKLNGADYWFHVSSEGELEQVVPFIKYLNLNSKKVLLIYTSPSVDKSMMNLKSKYQYLEVMRFPVLNGSSLSELRLPRFFFMVRYDFFPRLLMIASQKSVKSVLLSATMKNKKESFITHFWWEKVYNCFDNVFWAAGIDTQMAKSLSKKNIKSYEYDFRHAQIIERQKLKENLIALSGFDTFVKKLERFEYKKRVILGSAWASEISELTASFKNLIEKDHLIYIAPHHLKGEKYQEIKNILIHSQVSFCELSLLGDYQGESVILSRLPGVLCEIYPLFRHGFVGGGHGRSVHSLLEPYWASCFVYCGPKIHRSTEFDYIVKNSSEKIHICHEINGLEEAILKCDNNSLINIENAKDEIIKLSSDHIINLCNLETGKDS